MAQTDTLFRTPDLLVRRGPEFGGPVCFVTFSSHTLDRTLDRPGFGENFLASRGFDAIHVINRTNCWYDYPEIDEVLAKLRQATTGYSRVITYGSSMGGYAAVRFAQALGAQTAQAPSPQYAQGPPGASFERRFYGDPPPSGRRLPPSHRSATVTPYLFFDSRDPDALHARLIACHYPNTVRVAIPHAGHPAGAYLEETALLTNTVIDIVNDRFDSVAATAAARRKRRQSSHYLYTLAIRLRPARLDTKIALVETGLRRRDDAVYRLFLSLLLESRGDLAGAEDQLRLSGDLLPDHQRSLAARARFLMRRGRWSEAEPILIDLTARFAGYPENLGYLSMFTVALVMQGRSLSPVWDRARGNAGLKALLALVAVCARLQAAGLGHLLPQWHKKAFALSPNLEQFDEWRRRRETRRRLARTPV